MNKMDRKKELRLYNVLFPIWMLIWWPSWLWLVLIPLNYGVDALVLHLSLPADADRRAFCRKHTWKICLAGFLSDFLGSAAIFGLYALDLSRDFTYDIAYDPFGSPAAFAATVAAIGISAAAIFLLDRRILLRAGLDPEAARRAARNMAVFTAPYLFLIPSGLLYR